MIGQRMEGLRHDDHHLVAGQIAVRMKLVDDVAHRPRRLFGVGVHASGQGNSPEDYTS
jgi:hypothetical protein